MNPTSGQAADIAGKRPKFVLLESAPGGAKRQSKKGILLSVLLHAAAVAAAVILTVGAGIKREAKAKAERIVFIKPETPKPIEAKPEPPKPIVKKAEPQKVHVAPRPAAPAPRIPSIVMPPAPLAIPTEIPKINIAMPVTVEPPTGSSGLRSNEKMGGTAAPKEGGLGSGDANKAYSDYEVEEEARPGGGSPNYPDFLRQSGTQGQVQAQFIIGPNGRVENGSIKILHSTHDEFTRAVKDYLNRAKYVPGKVGGRGVRQVVQQAFSFKLDR